MRITALFLTIAVLNLGCGSDDGEPGDLKTLSAKGSAKKACDDDKQNNGNKCRPPATEPDCTAMDARGRGDCLTEPGFVWDGQRCVTIGGCRCLGKDCDRVFGSAAECAAAYADCIPTQCYPCPDAPDRCCPDPGGTTGCAEAADEQRCRSLPGCDWVEECMGMPCRVDDPNCESECVSRCVEIEVPPSCTDAGDEQRCRSLPGCDWVEECMGMPCRVDDPDCKSECVSRCVEIEVPPSCADAGDEQRCRSLPGCDWVEECMGMPCMVDDPDCKSECVSRCVEVLPGVVPTEDPASGQ